MTLLLQAVAPSVGVCWATVLESSRTASIQGAEAGEDHYPTFAGFDLSELAVLWRCRMRTQGESAVGFDFA
jgi:hypothetical protein